MLVHVPYCNIYVFRPVASFSARNFHLGAVAPIRGSGGQKSPSGVKRAWESSLQTLFTGFDCGNDQGLKFCTVRLRFLTSMFYGGRLSNFFGAASNGTYSYYCLFMMIVFLLLCCIKCTHGCFSFKKIPGGNTEQRYRMGRPPPRCSVH